MTLNDSTPKRRSGVAVAFAVLAVLGSGWAAPAAYTPPPSAAVLDTLSPGWEQKFRLQWNVVPETSTTRTVDGYLHNESGTTYTVSIQLLAFDQAGNVVARQIRRLPGEIRAFGRDYFQFRNVPAADQYRVSVFSYDPWNR